MDAHFSTRTTQAVEFDRVTVVPRLSDVHPDHVILNTRFARGLNVASPFVPSPMDAVIGLEMIKAAHSLGMAVTVPFRNPETANFRLLKDYNLLEQGVFGALIPTDTTNIASLLRELSCNVAFWAIDSLHISPHKHLDTVKLLKDMFPAIPVVSGNVVHGQDAATLIDAGVDAVRVGMSDASINRGEELIGCARSQLAAVMDCSLVCKDQGVPLISDGGIGNIADALKAMAFGADTVMMGALFAATTDSPAETAQEGSQYFKVYQGMSISSKISTELIAEGATMLLPLKGSLAQEHAAWVKTLCLGISRAGCRSIQELQQKSELELC